MQHQELKHFPEFVHPVSKVKLTPDHSGSTLSDPVSGDSFPVIDGLPVLLPLARDLSPGEMNYEAHYQKDGDVYDYFTPPAGNNERAEIDRLHQYILEQIPAGTSSVLDVGCGGGWLAKALVPKGIRVISMDISTANPRKALALIPHENHFGLVADAMFLPLKEGSVDCIIASEIIEHVPDPRAFLGAIYPALSPAGRLIVTTPYNELIRYSLCIHCNNNTPHNAHLHSFTEQSLLPKVPAGAVNVHAKIINAKVFSLMRVLSAMDFLPFPAYKLLDNLAIGITRKKAFRIMLVLEKPGLSQ